MVSDATVPVPEIAEVAGGDLSFALRLPAGSFTISAFAGAHVKAFKKCLALAFEVEQQLAEMLLRRLGKRLRDFGEEATSYSDRIYYLVTTANSDGWAGDLYRECRHERPTDENLILFDIRLRPHSQVSGH